jgi:hypothetical protein
MHSWTVSHVNRIIAAFMQASSSNGSHSDGAPPEFAGSM